MFITGAKAAKWNIDCPESTYDIECIDTPARTMVLMDFDITERPRGRNTSSSAIRQVSSI
jgi:hypothetical protein